MAIRVRTILIAGLPVLAIILIGWAAWIAVDLTRAADSPHTPENTILHAVGLTGFGVLSIIAATVFTVLLLRADIVGVITQVRANQDRRLDAIAKGQADLAARAEEAWANQARRLDAIADSQTELATKVEQAWANQPTAEIRHLVGVPAIRSSSTTYGPIPATTGRPQSGQIKTRRRSARNSSRRQGSTPTGSDPVPEQYLADITKAVDLGRKLERGRQDPTATA